ncbi:glutamate carboxypeptidase [Mesorhizobium sp. J18]|uniref:peptidase dimerization domain-containing protein n=1 Tax=Mesorhizobium sp. J18 TaxID=935263 RepID=UPI00119C1222|nr:peptidase dimerization domain-containing protein [Mesorhizobium sp. J18]TWG91121.1 glutamate carboxypeptidase [Mesorhizobium sp. J18]
MILESGTVGPSLIVGRKGVGVFQFEIDGAEAHAGIEPEKGANSILEAAHQMLFLQTLQRPEIGTTINPGVIQGGTKPYVVPGQCRISVDFRVETLAEQKRIESELQAAVDSVHIAGTRMRASGRFHRPPMEATESRSAMQRRFSRSDWKQASN